MKKLLALLLLSPLAFGDEWDEAGDQYASNSLDLESFDRFLPNDTYIALICYGDTSGEQGNRFYLSTLSLEEKKGINLLEYRHAGWIDNSSFADDDGTNFSSWNRKWHSIMRNENWARHFSANDFYISIMSPGYSYIDRSDLENSVYPCKKTTSVDEIKEFASKVERLYQKHQKIIDDNYQRRLNKRKL